ncbi:hypothetical protein F4810DRAFT_705853 [Camillea tinctor]|nr:hypothetical protein F4810DRAFT_705853 [Camillea tinctor]
MPREDSYHRPPGLNTSSSSKSDQEIGSDQLPPTPTTMCDDEWYLVQKRRVQEADEWDYLPESSLAHLNAPLDYYDSIVNHGPVEEGGWLHVSHIPAIWRRLMDKKKKKQTREREDEGEGRQDDDGPEIMTITVVMNPPPTGGATSQETAKGKGKGKESAAPGTGTPNTTAAANHGSPKRPSIPRPRIFRMPPVHLLRQGRRPETAETETEARDKGEVRPEKSGTETVVKEEGSGEETEPPSKIKTTEGEWREWWKGF